MTIQFTNTSEASKYKTILVYGKSGVGKTRLCRTAIKPIIISSERKLASLQGEDIPVIFVTTIDDFEDALNYSVSKKAKKFKTVCVDSISDIVEKAVLAEKKNQADPRRAYAIIQDKVYELLDQIAEYDYKNFYIIAKAKMTQNEDNVDQYSPKMPGQQMGPEMPYRFDFVFPLRVVGDPEDGDLLTYLQTNLSDDIKWDAKDSSGKLSPREKPNLARIFKKLNG